MKKVFWGLAVAVFAAIIYFFLMPAFAGKIVAQPFFSIGPVNIRWYGLLMAAAVLVGYFVARKNCWRFGIDKLEIDNITFWLVIIGLIGGRLYYVLFDMAYFARDPAEIYRIWHGGLSIFGSIIASIIFLFLYARNKAYSIKQLLDLVALAVPLAHAFGRFGNFFNQEAFGLPTMLPWKMYVQPNRRPAGFGQNEFFHPTFLYEALFNAGLFVLLFYLKDRLKPGQLAAVYLAGYSVGRFFIEILRLDSAFLSGFRADQVVAFLMLGFATVLFFKWDEPHKDH